MNDLVLRLPDALLAAAQARAAETGVSVEEVVREALESRLRALDDLRLLRERAARARPGAWQALLDRAPDVEPAPQDRLPAGR